MCHGCWVEAGSPEIITPAIVKAAALVTELYALPECGAGGNLHIVTDDWNIDDECVRFCDNIVRNGGVLTDNLGRQYIRNGADELRIEREILDLILPMSESERASVLGLEAGYFARNPGEKHEA